MANRTANMYTTRPRLFDYHYHDPENGNEKDLKELFNEAEREAKLEKKELAISLFTGVIERCEQYLVFHAHEERTDHVMKLLALAYNNRGHLQYLQVDFDDAVADYSQSIRIYPTLAVAHYNRGLIHYRLGRFAEAVQDQESALKLDPTFNSARQCLQQAQRDLDLHTMPRDMGSPVASSSSTSSLSPASSSSAQSSTSSSDVCDSQGNSLSDQLLNSADECHLVENPDT